MFRQGKKGTRSPRPITPPWVEKELCKVHRIRVGQVLELAEREIGQRDGDFLLVVSVLRNVATDETKVRGLRIKRCSAAAFFGMLPRKLNEVCILLPHVGHGSDDVFLQTLEDVDIEDCQMSINGRPLKRDVVFTNEAYPAKSFRDPDAGLDHVALDDRNGLGRSVRTIEQIFRQSLLVCRWAWVQPPNVSTSSDGLPYQQLIRRLRDTETDDAKSDHLHSLEWHGQTYDPSKALTYADGFCGCGGFALGAKDAGYKVIWAFDADPQAIASFVLNHPGADGYTAFVDSFLGLDRIPHVAVLHISPPCQAFSPANTLAGLRDPGTAAGMHDDANSAASFCIGELLRKVRPRVVTMEQTSGVLTHRSPYFRGIVAQFTDAGYSVQWKLLDFAAYGLPQHRRRIIIIASCPGGVLPDFPAAVRGDPVSGLQPYTTIAQCLRRVDHHSQYHDPPAHEDPSIEGYGDYQLSNLINTSGTIALHPRHGRKYTNAELMELMLFPSRSFRFGTGQSPATILRQIGNAVPPTVAKIILRGVRRLLKKEDRERAPRERSVTAGLEGTTEDTPIVL